MGQSAKKELSPRAIRYCLFTSLPLIVKKDSEIHHKQIYYYLNTWWSTLYKKIAKQLKLYQAVLKIKSSHKTVF